MRLPAWNALTDGVKMSQTDFYAMLLLSHTASPQEIKGAYRRLATQYHPDKNEGNPVADEIMKKINEAYDTLSNPQKRKAYDSLFLCRQPESDLPEFAQGERVRIRADSGTPYTGRDGVVVNDPVKDAFRFWYTVRFDSTGFVTVVRLAQEQLEKADS